jgi:hypothetical protein
MRDWMAKLQSKVPIRERIKVVVEALRQGKKTWSDLKELNIPDKTLQRVLEEYLEYSGLARKEEGFWVWYEYSKIFNSEFEYQRAIEHSKELIPALESILNLKETERNDLYSAAREHLKHYPEIFVKLEKFEELYSQRERQLCKKYESKIKTAENFMILDPVQKKGKGILGRFSSETKFVRRKVPYIIDWGEDRPTTDEMKEIDELRTFLDEKVFTEKFEIYGELAKDIHSLIFKITISKEPLEGKCSLCPKIRIQHH